MELDTEHEWELMSGSNSSYRCKKCGINGHVPRHELSVKVRVNYWASHGGSCALNTMENIHNA